MQIYDIDNALAALVDPDTGEITDFEKFEQLFTERNEAIEQLCLVYKDLIGDAAKIKAEKKNLEARIAALEKNAKHLHEHIQFLLNGQPFKTPRVVVSFRSSTGTVVDDEFIEWAQNNAPDLLTYKDPTANLTAIKKALQAGEELEGHAALENRSNMSIK